MKSLLSLLCLSALLACGRAPLPPQAGTPPRSAPLASAPLQAGTSIPPEAWQVLAYIRTHGEAPAGYEGGRHFGNYERVLPQEDAAGRRIQYQEWDLHPHREHVNRGAERIVTGSDGRAWFTRDHYQHFAEMKAAP